MPDPKFGSGPSDATVPSDWYVAITPGPDEIAEGKLCRAILCSEDGALDLTDSSGLVRANIPVQQGYNPLRASVIDEPTSGTAPATVVAIF